MWLYCTSPLYLNGRACLCGVQTGPVRVTIGGLSGVGVGETRSVGQSLLRSCHPVDRGSFIVTAPGWEPLDTMLPNRRLLWAPGCCELKALNRRLQTLDCRTETRRL